LYSVCTQHHEVWRIFVPEQRVLISFLSSYSIVSSPYICGACCLLQEKNENLFCGQLTLFEPFNVLADLWFPKDGRCPILTPISEFFEFIASMYSWQKSLLKMQHQTLKKSTIKIFSHQCLLDLYTWESSTAIPNFAFNNSVYFKVYL